MAFIFNKTFESITAEDSQLLIDREVSERQNLEYKSKAYARNDENVREMLRDISSMANSYGGYIFLGIKEKDDQSGLPVELVGIDEAEKERNRIFSSCLVNIEPRLSGLQIKVINLDGEKSILVIFVSRSTRAPHMITFKGLNQFWIRHDRQKSKMSVDEIREAFLKTENILRDIQNFLQNRHTELLKEIDHQPYYIVGASPLLIKEDIIDVFDQQVRDLLKNPPGQRREGWNLDFGVRNDPRPTLWGLKIEIKGFKFVELFRNGYLQAAMNIQEESFVKEQVRISGKDHSVLYPYPLVEYPVSFFRLLKSLREHLGLEGPFVAFVSLLNIQGFGLRRWRPQAISYSHDLEIWGKQHLEIPPSQIATLSDPDKTAKSFIDRVWQAFGYEKAPLFKEGKFDPGS